MLLAAEARYGRRGLLRIWLAAVADLLINVPIEYISIWRERRIMSRKSVGVLILTLALSALTGYVNVTASEVQAPMLCILLFSFVTGLLQPRGRVALGGAHRPEHPRFDLHRAGDQLPVRGRAAAFSHHTRGPRHSGADRGLSGGAVTPPVDRHPTPFVGSRLIDPPSS